jgi:tetratricopeptide (TPR) repeat protein
MPWCRIIAAVVLGPCTGALAKLSPIDISRCTHDDDPPERAEACTRVIDSSAYSGAEAAWAYLDRGLAYENLAQYDRAIRDYDEAIRLQPNRGLFFADRGNAYQDKGQYERAIQDYDAAIRLDPSSVKAFNDRCSANMDVGRYDQALSDCNAALRIDPKHANIYNNRCYLRAILGDTTQAIAGCDKSLELANDPCTLDSRGYAYLRSCNFDRAIADYDAALKVDGKIGTSLYGRAVAYAAKGDRTRAATDLAAARALNPRIDQALARVHIAAPTGL